MADENTATTNPPRPPDGVMPRWRHEELRAEDLANAIIRYERAGKTPPPEWREELDELVPRIMDRQDRRALQVMAERKP